MNPPEAGVGAPMALPHRPAFVHSTQTRDFVVDSDEQFRLLIANATDFAIFTVDADGRVTTWNAGAQRIKGYEAGEVLGKEISIFYPPEDAAAGSPQRAMQAAAREGRHEEESWRVRKDGTRFLANVITVALRDASGQLRGFGKITRDITERRRTEDALRASEERLSADLACMTRLHDVNARLVQAGDMSGLLQELVDAAIAITAADMGTLQLPDRASQLLRIRASRGLDATFLEHFDVVQPGQASCGSALTCGRRVIVEDVASSPLFADAPSRNALRSAGVRAVQSTPLLGRTGAVIGILSTYYRTPRRTADRDLTILDLLARQAADWFERTQDEVALRENEQRLRWALQSAGGGAWDWDLKTNEAWWSDEMYELWSVDPGRRMHVNDSLTLIHEEDRGVVLSSAQDAIANGADYTCVFRIRHPRLGERWMASYGRVVRDGAAQPLRMLGITLDITQRMRAEQALTESQEHLRAILETAVDAIITIDGRGLMQSVNPATERMFGYAAKDMIGQNVKMLMPAPYHLEHDEYIARYLRTGEKRIIGIGREVQARRADGGEFPVDLAVSEVEPGKLFTGIIRDISERKRSEGRLREADRMASIGSLAAGLGHDMNNVLLPVRAHLNVLSACAGATEASREHIDRIHKGVAYLQQLADGLHFLAMDPDKVDDGEGVTDVHQWWSRTGPLLSKAVGKHVKVSTSLPGDLPQIAVAPHALTQAALNLIVNASDAILPQPRHQGHVRLWARINDDGRSITLAVTDNGTGMTDEVKRRAFDMFFTTKPRGLGTGLGLAMVRKVIDRAGGRVEIQSKVGKGTTVAMILPVVEAREHLVELRAHVCIADGRAASLVQSLLEGWDVHVQPGDDDPGAADIWVVDPASAKVEAAATWREARPHGRVVLFGRPQGPNEARWDALEPIMIDTIDDFDAVRAGLAAALSDF